MAGFFVARQGLFLPHYTSFSVGGRLVKVPNHGFLLVKGSNRDILSVKGSYCTEDVYFVARQGLVWPHCCTLVFCVSGRSVMGSNRGLKKNTNFGVGAEVSKT